MYRSICLRYYFSPFSKSLSGILNFSSSLSKCKCFEFTFIRSRLSCPKDQSVINAPLYPGYPGVQHFGFAVHCGAKLCWPFFKSLGWRDMVPSELLLFRWSVRLSSLFYSIAPEQSFQTKLRTIFPCFHGHRLVAVVFLIFFLINSRPAQKYLPTVSQ